MILPTGGKIATDFPKKIRSRKRSLLCKHVWPNIIHYTFSTLPYTTSGHFRVHRLLVANFEENANKICTRLWHAPFNAVTVYLFITYLLINL